MNTFLPWLYQATLAGSGAILLTLILMPPLRRFLGARAAFPAWGFALAMLISPWFVRSPVSILPPASDLPPIVVQVVVPRTLPVAGSTIAQARETPFPWMLALWASGAIGCLVFSLLQVMQTHRLVRRSRCVTPGVRSEAETLGGLPSRTRVLESPEIRSPAMCGTFRPVIFLPAGWRNDPNLRWILLHEIGHIRRGDMIWRWAFQIVRALHWFNPLVWIADLAARRDQEMACDEWVLTRMGAGNAADYGEAILRAASQSRNEWFIRAGMAESKSGLTRRIRHLATAHPRGFWATALMVLLGLTILLLLSPGLSPLELSKPPAPPLASPSLPSGPPTQIEIESKFVEVSPKIAEEIFGAGNSKTQTILSEKEFANLVRSLDQKKDIDLMSAPKVTTKAGRKAIVRVVREFPYPTEYAPPGIQVPKPGENFTPYLVPATPMAFEIRNVGIELEVDPRFSTDHRIICQLSPSVVEFLGFVNYGAGVPSPTNAGDDALETAIRPVTDTGNVINQPIFRARKMETTVILRSGQTVVLGGLSRSDKQAVAATRGFPAGFPPQQGTEDVERILYVFVTLRSLDAQGKSVIPSPPRISVQDQSPPTRWESSPADIPPTPRPLQNPPTPPTGEPKNLSYGTPVPTKSGFVTSPHAPYAGYVDLRGFAPGTEVKCPYTGKIFLAP